MLDFIMAGLFIVLVIFLAGLVKWSSCHVDQGSEDQ
ncbi:hypothetical protein ACUXCC_004591 [Cytobacillus horneckiae]